LDEEAPNRAHLLPMLVMRGVGSSRRACVLRVCCVCVACVRDPFAWGCGCF